MTVGEVRRLIEELPDDAPIWEWRYSDAGPMKAIDLSIEEVEIVVSGEDGWGKLLSKGKYGNGHQPSRPELVRKVLFFAGN